LRRASEDVNTTLRSERSLAFSLDPRDCEKLVAQLGIAGARWTAETKILSLYLDTPESAIGKLGFAYGIRRRGDATLNDAQQALDRFMRGLPGQKGWTIFRHAMSVAAPSDGRKLQGLLRTANTKQQLEVAFQSETKRSFWSLPVAGGSAGMVLEQAAVAGMGDTRLAHLTVTYAAAFAADVFDFIAAAAKVVPFRMTGETLALEAYRHLGRLDVPLPGAITPRLTLDMSAATAFRVIAHATIDHFLLAQARVCFLSDKEGVHQARVALRRFSAAWRLFSPLVAGGDTNVLKEDLQHFKDPLRAARDLDVLLADLTKYSVENPALPAAPVRKLLEARREKAYAALVSALKAPDTEALLLRVVAWVDAGEWTRDAARTKDRDELIGAFVQRKFSKLIQKFARRADVLEEASSRARHRTRIHAKNLRYDVEFLDNLVRIAGRKGLRKNQRAFVGALKRVQSFLGEENDVLMAHSYFAGLGRDEDPVTADEAAKVAGTTIAAHLRPSGKRKFHKTVAKARRDLFEVKPFWLDLARH
jgi:triphosphatase